MIALYKRPTDEEFIELSKKCASMREFIYALGYGADTGKVRNMVKQRFEQLGVEPPHMSGADQTRAARFAAKIPDEQYFVKGKLRKGMDIRKRLIQDHGVPNQCAICGLPGEWNGKPLNLQVDHINGDHSDNRIENLRLVCPNCHSQTDTYCGKNIKK